MTRSASLDAYKVWNSYPLEFQQRIVDAFCEGARFQLAQMMVDPQWAYVENFNREYARAKRHLSYSNTISPIVHEEVARLVPEVKDFGQGGEQAGLF